MRRAPKWKNAAELRRATETAWGERPRQGGGTDNACGAAAGAVRRSKIPAMRTYVIRRLAGGSRPGHWTDPIWSAADTVAVDQFHPRSTDHRPITRASVLYDTDHLYVRFEVEDRYVRCVHAGYQQMVCLDSCVEFFVRPGAAGGYFNFEVNCGGSLLLYYIEDWRRVPGGFAGYTTVDAALGEHVKILHSLPPRVDPEIVDPVRWFVMLTIPLSVLRAYAAFAGPSHGDVWSGNFYKCGDRTSHPHWASWSPIGERLDFHQPERFGQLLFD